MERSLVVFEPAGVQTQVPRGATIHEAAAEAGVTLDAPCGGHARCGRCRVTVTGEVSPVTDEERGILGERAIAEGARLSCRARVLGPMTVTLPHPAGELRILGSAAEVAADRAHASNARLGIAIDIGTTTLAVELVELGSAATLATATAANPQRRFGHDVMTRLSHAAEADGAGDLHAVLVEELSRLCAEAVRSAGRDVRELDAIVVCGNTVMTHLLLRADTTGLATAPYRPAVLTPAATTADALGLTGLAATPVHILPGAAAFIGGDVVAGLLATDIEGREDAALLLDLGTNGELVIWTGERLVATSTAAGPAFEAAGIEWGMAATDGAIERVDLVADDLRFETIGGLEPRGLCGSGLLDLAAVLLETSVVDASGRMHDAHEAQHALAARVIDDADGVRTFVVDRGNDVRLTQMDVRQLQLAKGAVQTGVDVLLEAGGVEAPDVADVIVAGGFGHHIRPAALVALGVVPRFWRGRITFGRNTALAGARLALVDPAARQRATELAKRIETIDLATAPLFNERFLAAMSFPQR